MRVLRLLLGLLLIVSGSALTWPALAASEGQQPGWSFLGFGLPAPIVWGLGLLLGGGLMVWTSRHRSPVSKAPEPQIDIAPIVEWVRDFEKHQAELCIGRERPVSSGKEAEMALEPIHHTSKKSKQQSKAYKRAS
jgi:hypothetical protein